MHDQGTCFGQGSSEWETPKGYEMKRFEMFTAAQAVVFGGLAIAGGQTMAGLLPGLDAEYRVVPAAVGKAQLPTVVRVGAPVDESTLKDVVVFLTKGKSGAALAEQYGFTAAASLGAETAWKFTAASPEAARAAVARMQADGAVVSAELDRPVYRQTFAFVPNDPLYGPGTTTSTGGQWHLRNTSTTGRDAGVVGAWNRDVTGSGVVIGIVDDGLERTHPDLQPNYSEVNSRDFVANDGDPTPTGTQNHGTAVAGVAAARGGNGLGGTGAAPLAQLAGLKVGFGSTGTTSQFVNATTYRSSGATAEIDVKNHSYGYTAAYIAATSEVNALATSAAAGTIHVFAAGNNRGFSAQDTNMQASQNSVHVISVAALSASGRWSYYSNFGAANFVTAPSNGATGNGSGSSTPGITTTDRVGSAGYNGLADQNYTNGFGGTSSAAPLVAGVMGLLKEVRPGADVRFAKHLLARTSKVVDATDSSTQGDGDGVTAGSAWKTNGAGLKFNQNYGFGLIDADALTLAATLYSGVTPAAKTSTGTIAVNQAIPDNNLTGVTRTFSTTVSDPLEALEVQVNLTHTYRGDLEGFLTNPAGLRTRLFTTDGDSTDNLSWTFTTNAYWGENPSGTWSLQLRDRFAVDLGTWTSFAVSFNTGSLILAPVGGDPKWLTNGGGSWENGANWAGGVPNAVGAAANFVTSLTSASTVTLGSAKTVGTVKFDSAESYSVSGGAITTDNGANVGEIRVVSGSHTISSQVIMSGGLNVVVESGASVLALDGGLVGAGGLVKSGAGRLDLSAADVGGLTISGGELRVTGGAGGLQVEGLTIAAGALLNAASSSVLVDYTGSSPIADVIAAWLDGRIVADTDAGGLPTYLAIAEAFDLGASEFNGVVVDDTAVLVKFTYVGDANLDGQVDALDYERVDLSIGNNGVFGTAQGDINYDGIVDALDYEQIDLNIGNGVGAPLSTVFVPEPASMAGLVLAGLVGLRRRR
jgi:subtilisin family serine protease